MPRFRRKGIILCLAASVSAFGHVKEKTGYQRTTTDDVTKTTTRTTTESPVEAVKGISSFSPIGQKVINTLLEEEFPRGTLWDMHGDVEVREDAIGPWLMQHPPKPHFGQSGTNLNVAAQCTDGDNCNVDFGSFGCETDEDCAAHERTESQQLYAPGLCKAVHSTVTKPGGIPERLCVSHSYSHYENVYNTMIQAKEFIDVTSLDSSDGIGYGGAPNKYTAAMRNALTYLSHTGNPVIVKFHFGAITAAAEDTKVIIDEFTRDMNKESEMQVFAGTTRTSTDSWNHGKIVAVDGKALLQGGSNYYPYDYLMEHPVHDISMKTTGSNAITAHLYSENLWSLICEDSENRPPGGVARYSLWANGVSSDQEKFADSCPPAYKPPEDRVRAYGESRIISVARMGRLESEDVPARQAADEAFLALFSVAKSTIKISQQDALPVLFPKYLPGFVRMAPVGFKDSWRMLGGVADALVRGVDVYFVLSNPCSFGANMRSGESWSDDGLDTGNECPSLASDDPNGPGDGFDLWGQPADENVVGRRLSQLRKAQRDEVEVNERRQLTYGYGWSADNLADWFFAYFDHVPEARPEGATPADIIDLICTKTHITNIRVEESEPTYPEGHQIGNHAKVIIIDEDAFYMGSHNFYGAGLQEFGEIADDKQMTQQLLDDYYNPMWEESKAGAVTGSPDGCPWRERLATRSEYWHGLEASEFDDSETAQDRKQNTLDQMNVIANEATEYIASGATGTKLKARAAEKAKEAFVNELGAVGAAKAARAARVVKGSSGRASATAELTPSTAMRLEKKSEMVPRSSKGPQYP